MAWGGFGQWIGNLFNRNAGAGQVSNLARSGGGTPSIGTQAPTQNYSIMGGQTGASAAYDPSKYSLTTPSTQTGAFDPSQYSVAPAGSYPGQVGGAPPQQPGALSRLAGWAKDKAVDWAQDQRPGQGQTPSQAEEPPQSQPPPGEEEPKTPLQPSGSGRDIGAAHMMNTKDPQALESLRAQNRELQSIGTITHAGKTVIAAAAGGAAGAGAGAAGGAGSGFGASFMGGMTGAGGGGSMMGGALGGVAGAAMRGGGGGQTTATPTVGVTGESTQPNGQAELSALAAESEATRPKPKPPMGMMGDRGPQAMVDLDYRERYAKAGTQLGGGIQQHGPYRWWTGATPS